MNKQDNGEAKNSQQSRIEDLTVDGDQGTKVKGGTIVMKTIRFKPGKDVEPVS